MNFDNTFVEIEKNIVILYKVIKQVQETVYYIAKRRRRTLADGSRCQTERKTAWQMTDM